MINISRRLGNLTSNLTASIFWKKHDIDNGGMALKLQRVHDVSKFHELWCINGL